MPWSFSSSGNPGGFNMQSSGNPGGMQMFPSIVTSGLLLNLDAGNPASYPGTGTTWTDLSGNNNTGTLINGPTFSGANSGFILTDGINDYIEVTTRNINLEFQPTQAHSAFCWLYNMTGSAGIIVGNMSGSGTFPGWNLLNTPGKLNSQVISVWNTSAVSITVDFDFTANANKWVYIGYTYDGSCPTTTQGSLDSMNIYANGQLLTSNKASQTTGFTTSNATTTYPTNQRFRIGSRWASTQAITPARLNIAQAKIYNKKLTTTEILQNYNATRRRFGL